MDAKNETTVLISYDIPTLNLKIKILYELLFNETGHFCTEDEFCTRINFARNLKIPTMGYR